MKTHNYILTNEQNHVVEKLLAVKRLWVIGEIGAGKTVVGCEVIQRLLHLDSFLIVAPVGVIKHVWKKEVKKYNFRDIKTVTKSNRLLTSPESVKNLINKDFKVIIIDESTKFKNSSCSYDVLKKLISKADYVISLTGSPLSGASHLIYTQLDMLCIQNNLANSLKEYMETYISYVVVNKAYKLYYDIGHGGNKENTQRNYRLIYNNFKNHIVYLKAHKKIDANLIVHNFKLSEYITDALEHLIITNTYVHDNFPYRFKFGAIKEKSKQLHLGFLLIDDIVINVHRERLNILEQIIKSIIKKGENCLIYIRYVHEKKMINRMIQSKIDVNHDVNASYDEWNNGSVKCLLLSYQSASHGLNLQHGGSNIIWFSYPIGYEYFEQANGRLKRSGQKSIVNIHLIRSNYQMDRDAYSNIMNKRYLDKGFIKLVKEGI